MATIVRGGDGCCVIESVGRIECALVLCYGFAPSEQAVRVLLSQPTIPLRVILNSLYYCTYTNCSTAASVLAGRACVTTWIRMLRGFLIVHYSIIRYMRIVSMELGSQNTMLHWMGWKLE